MPAAHTSHARRLLPLALATVGVLVVSGAVVSVVDEPVLRASASAPVHTSQISDTDAGAADAGAAARAARKPDGRVEIRSDWTPMPLPPGWSRVRPILASAVDQAADLGLDLTYCVQAVDAEDERHVCAGSGDEMYAASVTKIAYAVGALEAWGGDPDAKILYGDTVGEVVDDAITVSDNDAADRLVRLAALGPDAVRDDPFDAINAISARVGLDDAFHSGNYYTLGYWSADWSHLTAEGAMRYVTELVRAADGRAEAGTRPLTTPRVARYVLDAMYRQERTTKIPRELPAGSTANKTGETDTVSHDVGVVNTASGRYSVVAISTASGLFAGPEDIVAETTAAVVRALGGGARF